MNVRCKFKVESVTKYTNGVGSVKLTAVTNGSEENKAFWKWTPGGELNFQSINESAMAQFTPGADYYIDITAA